MLPGSYVNLVSEMPQSPRDGAFIGAGTLLDRIAKCG